MAASATGFDWGSLLGPILNGLIGSNTANNNQSTANQYGQQTQYTPYNLTYGNANVGFQGNNAVGQLSPTYQGLQDKLTGQAGGLLGGLNFGNGGINDYLSGAMGQYDQSAPAPNLGGINPQSQNMGNQFNQASQGFLGGLGGFNPQDAASSYTNNLRAQAQPLNQQAAESTAQNLFNTGRLGSTGGANLYGQLINQQNQQDLGFQLAGQQYGGQEQNRIAGLAQGFGQAGDALNNQAFSRQVGLGQAQFDQGNQRSQQRFQNAMNLFGAGQQNLNGQVGNSLGLIQGSQGLDQNLLQAIGLGGTLGAQKSATNQNAFNPSLQAGVAGNNTTGAAINAISGPLGDWLKGLFGGNNGTPATTTPSAGGAGGGYSVPQTPSAGSGFSSAGGEAASGLGGLDTATPGSLFGSSGAGALGAAAPVGAGVALSGLGSATAGGLFGTSGSAAAGAGAGSLGGGTLASATGAAIPSTVEGAVGTGASAGASAGSGLGAAVAGSGLSTAMPLAAIGFAFANAVNAGGKADQNKLAVAADFLTKNAGWKKVGIKSQTYQLPDGSFVQMTGDSVKNFARSFTEGQDSPQVVQQKFEQFVKDNTKPNYKLNPGKNYGP